jgi:endo-alpha-N-acetylgalactosaminidase
VTGTVANLSGPTANNVSVALDLPAGWTASPSTPDTIGTLAPGASQQESWTVTIPDDVAQGSYAVAAIATYEQGGSTSRTTGGSYGLTVIPKGLVYISDLPFVSATNGFGPVERDMNVGGPNADDGGPLSIDGVGYAKGLGTNAISSVVIDVPAGCTSFSSYVGVDDSAGGKGSVTFSVLADGTQVASTGVMRGGQPAQLLTANITGVSQLILNVGDAGDGIGHDNGDWGDAELMCAG